MALFGIVSILQITLVNTLIQLIVPDRLRGRMMGFFLLVWGLMPIGTVLIGQAAEVFGVQAAVAAANVLGVVLTIGIGASMAKSISRID